MPDKKIGAFEVVLLIVGITASILGFQLINNIYLLEGRISWLMLITLFNWIILLVLFVLLSLTVDVSKRQLIVLERISSSLEKKKGKK